MKHIFIINPMAGSGGGAALLKERIAALDCECEIHETLEAGEATTFVRGVCEACVEPVRFYACGGDGTAKEVAEGVVGFAHASMTVCPIGSGNDFVKYFGGADGFLNLEAIIAAESEPTDIIHIKDDEGDDTYSLNVCNFGFEAEVARYMNRFRRKPVIGGKNAYTTGILCAIFTAMKTRGKVYADGELLNESGVFLLGTAANGGYVGGGYHCAPRASVTDGYLEVCLVKPLSIFTLARLIGVYKEGKHLEDKRFEKYLIYRRVKTIEVLAQEPIPVCLDGEIIESKHFVATAEQGALRFAAPTGELATHLC